MKINGPKPFTLNKGKLMSIANNSVTNTYINSLLKRRKNKRQYVVSANNAGNVNGFAIIGPNYNINNQKFMYLHLIAIRNKGNKGISRGKGVGTALLARIVQNAKNRRVNEILLHAIPRAKNWYTKVGFKKPNYGMGNNNMMALNIRTR